MRDHLLVVWIALIGADRIDLLGGAGPFVLSPFLVLTPVVLVSELWGVVADRGRLLLPARTAWYVLVATAFLSVALVSVMFAYDVGVGARRGLLLVVQLYMGIAVAVALAGRPGAGRILARGAYAGLALALLFNVGQLAVFLDVADNVLAPVVELAPNTYMGIIPRLAGQSGDQNRSGLLFLVYLVFLVRFARRGALRHVFVGLAAAMILLTLSRSALLACAVAAAAALLRGRGPRVSRAALAAGAGTVALAVLVLLLRPGAQEALLAALEPLGARFSVEEGSASVHFALIERGWEVGRASLRNVLVGVGFGNSFAVLQDFFPGSEYGNFHSLYVTLLVESGVFALALGLVLLLVPAASGGAWQPLVMGFVFFSIFYQAQTDPMFWLVLALAWLRVEPGPPGATAPAADEPQSVRPPAPVLAAAR